MDIQLLLETLRAEALKNLLEPTVESLIKSFCRTYSQRFYTPLPQVYKLPIEDVISEVLASQLEGVDAFEHLDDILDQIYTLENPDYQKQKEEEMEAFAKFIEKKEKKRVEVIKKKELLENENIEVKKKPTGGSLKFNLDEDKES